MSEITLLSKDEFNSTKHIIPFIKDDWWLRSSGNESYLAYCVFGLKDFARYANFYVDVIFGVRPVLKSSNLVVGNVYEIGKHKWTALTAEILLCNDIVGRSYFRDDSHAVDANDYEKSDIKKWLENWAKEEGII